ncbi:hypothetical protein BLOT_009670 [Blomia tropicalis]|nr:hypothetical protein BLOT_009670 [Blomia tropicalis]
MGQYGVIFVIIDSSSTLPIDHLHLQYIESYLVTMKQAPEQHQRWSRGKGHERENIPLYLIFTFSDQMYMYKCSSTKKR